MGQVDIELNKLHPVSSSRVRSESLRKLLGFWEERRKGRIFPARADFDPVDLWKLLGRLVLFDVLQDPRRFRFRLVGTDWVMRFGLDPTGQIVDDYPRVESRAYLNGILGQTVDWREPAVINRTVILNDQVCEYEALLLPLAGDGETIDMVMIGFELRS